MESLSNGLQTSMTTKFLVDQLQYQMKDHTDNYALAAQLTFLMMMGAESF
jgi:hypothetical protein